MPKIIIAFAFGSLLVWNLFIPAQVQADDHSPTRSVSENQALTQELQPTSENEVDNELEIKKTMQGINKPASKNIHNSVPPNTYRATSIARSNTTLDGIPNAPKPEKNLSATPGKSDEINISSWSTLHAAIINRKIRKIFIQGDIYNANNTRAIDVTTRDLTIYGNGYYIDFRNTSFELNSRLSKDFKAALVINNLTMYGYNYYGPFSVWSDPVSGAVVTLEYNDITYVGTQLTASWDWDIILSGRVENHSVNSYLSPYNNKKQEGNKNQANFEATNLIVQNNSIYNGTTENAGVIYLSNNGKMKIGDHSEVTLTANKNSDPNLSGEFSEQALYLEGTLEAGQNSKLTVNARETGDQYAIFINGSNNGFTVSKNAEIQLNGRGPSKDKALLDMQADTKILIDDNATLNLHWKNKGNGSASLLSVGANAEFVIGKKGVFNAISDGEGDQNILYFGNASIFRFTDAKKVNIQYINENLLATSSLIRMYGSLGELNVDVQSVEAWDKNSISTNSTRDPDLNWNPMFNMITHFNYSQSTFKTAETIYQDLHDDYMKHFIPENFSRLQYTEIGEVQLDLLNQTNDKVESVDSQTVRGKTNPGAYIRVTGDPALPTPTIPSNIVGSTDSEMTAPYTVIADHNGNFTVQAKTGKHFTTNSTIKVFSFLNGKSNVKEVTVIDKTAPIAEGRTLRIVKNDPLPSAKAFTLNATDTNPLNQEITYAFKENYQPLLTQIGTHSIIVNIADNFGNAREIPSKLNVESSRKGILADDFTVKLSDLQKYNSISALKKYLLKQSNAYAFEIVDYEKKDVTSAVTVKNSATIEQLKKGTYEITLEMIRGETYTKKFNVTVLDDAPVAPTNPENPGSAKPDEKENTGTGDSGLLKLDYVPTSFDFGEVTYGFEKTTVHAKKTTSTKQWVQVSDNRPKDTITSWTIVVAQNEALTSAAGKTLTGATITIPKGKVFNEASGNQQVPSQQLQSTSIEVSSSPQTIFSAENTINKMLNISTNVWEASAVQLTIPGGNDFDQTSYSNTINWTLVAEPNE